MREQIEKQIKDLKQEIRNAHPLQRFMLLAELRILCKNRDEIIKNELKATSE